MYVKVLGKEGKYGARIARFVHMSISPGAKRGKEGRYGGEVWSAYRVNCSTES